MRKPPNYIVDLLKPFGNLAGEPAYKFAWADDVLETSFGVEQKRFPEQAGFWLLMKFVEWKDYGEWNYEVFGPKPYVGGEYELSQVIAVEGQPVELWELPQDVLLLWVIATQRGKLPHKSEILTAHRDRLKKLESDWSRKFSDIYDDANSVAPYTATSIPGVRPGDQIGARTPDDTRIVTLDQLPERLRKQLMRPGLRQIT